MDLISRRMGRRAFPGPERGAMVVCSGGHRQNYCWSRSPRVLSQWRVRFDDLAAGVMHLVYPGVLVYAVSRVGVAGLVCLVAWDLARGALPAYSSIERAEAWART